MEHSIRVRDSYIYVTVEGKISLIGPSGWDEIKTALDNVVGTMREKEIYKVLVDGRGFTGKVSTIDRFLLAVFFVKENSRLMMNKIPPVKIAMVMNKATIDPKKFGETVARNRGLDGMVTDKIHEAFKWLDVEPPDDSKS